MRLRNVELVSQLKIKIHHFHSIKRHWRVSPYFEKMGQDRPKYHESVKKIAELTIVTMLFAWPGLDQA